MHYLSHTYDIPLFLLSVLIILFSSYIALGISSRLHLSRGWARVRWIVSGAVILGLGIWSMHFIGMLAFQLETAVPYRFSMVMLSVVPALIACGIAFYLVSKPALSKRRLVGGGLLIGTGIILMHHIGMEAMQMDAVIRHDLVLLMISAAIAYAASFTALHLMFRVRGSERFSWYKAGSAAVMALAASGMHYVGMAAASFSHAHGTVVSGAVSSGPLSFNIVLMMTVLFAMAFSSLRMESKLELLTDESDRKFQSVIESANDAVIMADENSIIIQWNDAARRIFGYTEAEAVGQELTLIIPEEFRNAHREGVLRYRSTKEAKVIGKTVELTGKRKDGTEFPVEMSLGTWSTEKGLFFSSIIRDITERKQTEDRINSLIYLDALTGLPNRRLLNDRLDAAIKQAGETGRSLSLLCLDLDRFKLINDTFGHQWGDQLLKEVAGRLQACTGKSDTLARLGGDEFMILLPQDGSGRAAELAQDILDSLSRPYHLNGEQIFITPSIGISLYPSDGRDEESLTRYADIAMYRVKEEGKNGFQFYKKEMNEQVSRKSRLAIAIRKALEEDQFTLHYQPQIDLATGRLIGAEALIRWVHPSWGMISPGEFIPIAEETGLIIQIGEQVLVKACRQNKRWQEAGLPPFRVAVNVSARQFANGDLAQQVRDALTISGLAPEYLELELTESIIQGSNSAVAVMQELKAMGVLLSIDDFGTGYSSLSYLKLFPIDTLKIDQHFTRNIEIDQKDAALVDTIIRMAHNLELNVIAEGVETASQLEFLKERGCNQAQGYYFEKPLTAEDLENRFYQPEKPSYQFI